MDNLAIEKKVIETIENLLSQTERYKTSDESIAQIEKGLLSSLLRLGLVLLSSIITHKSRSLLKYRPELLEGEILKSKGVLTRKYLSLFGLLEISRTVHWSKERKTYSELDERLELPPRLWSYNLSELVGESSTEVDYSNSVSLLNKLLCLDLTGKSSQRNVDYLGVKVVDYYANKSIEKERSSLFFSASFDGKGVPKIVKPTAIDGNPKKRLSKGEKKGKNKWLQ